LNNDQTMAPFIR